MEDAVKSDADDGVIFLNYEYILQTMVRAGKPLAVWWPQSVHCHTKEKGKLLNAISKVKVIFPWLRKENLLNRVNL